MSRVSASLLMAMLLASSGCRAASHDFDGVVQGLEQRYSLHAQRVPFRGLISFCARVASGGGMKSLEIAQIDNIRHVDPTELAGLITAELGGEWQPIVTSRHLQRGSNSGDGSFIYAAPRGNLMRMMIVDYSENELNIVRIKMDAREMARYMRNGRQRPANRMSN